MKKYFNNKKATNLLIGIFLAVIFAQALLIAKLYSDKDDKNYEVNLVEINRQKDSVDYFKMKNDLSTMDQTLRQINSFLLGKNVTDERLMALSQDSLSSDVYLAQQSNRYSQYLVNLEQKLQQIPIGMPSDGYISSNYGTRKNPIPVKPKVAATNTKPTLPIPQPEPQVIEEKDSLGNVIKRTVVQTSVSAPGKANNGKPIAAVEKNNPPAEADQMQFHKGLDIAVAYGSDVRSAAAGTVIFAGQKGGYGNCVIVSHGNGLATLYGHLSQILVQTNDNVKVNQIIAKTGNSGRSTGPHLHYEVHKNNTPVNPKLFMGLQ